MNQTSETQTDTVPHCPYCDHRANDAPDIGDEEVISCPNCGKDFTVRIRQTMISVPEGLNEDEDSLSFETIERNLTVDRDRKRSCPTCYSKAVKLSDRSVWCPECHDVVYTEDGELANLDMRRQRQRENLDRRREDREDGEDSA